MSTPIESLQSNLAYYSREMVRVRESLAWVAKYHLDDIEIPETASCYTTHRSICISNVANKHERLTLIGQVMDAAGVSSVEKEDTGGNDMKVEIPFGEGSVRIEYLKPCAVRRYRVTTKPQVSEVTICGEIDESRYDHVELIE